LGHVVQIQPEGTVVADFHAGCGHPILTEPGQQTGVRPRMLAMTNGGWYVNDSLNEFRLLQVRHRIEAALEFGAGEPVAILQRRDRLGHGGWGRRRSRIAGDRHRSLPPSLIVAPSRRWRMA